METNIKINQTVIYSEVFDEYGALFKEDGVSIGFLKNPKR